MGSPLFPFRPRKKLNFWDELDIKNQSLPLNKQIKIISVIGNERFASEVPLDCSRMTESEFRGISGYYCRDPLANGYFKLHRLRNYMKITMYKKPFRTSEISVKVTGEFIVIHAEHDFRYDSLETFKEFCSRKKHHGDNQGEEVLKDSKGKELGMVSRSMTRRYMLPSDATHRHVSYFTRENMDVLYIYVRTLTSSKPECERVVPIVVED